jgi:hypothetical protein
VVFVQRIQAAGDERCAPMGHGPDDCTVIDCVTTEPVLHHETSAIIHEAGAVVWHSHADAGIDPVSRLNPDHPHEDHRAAASP